MKDVCAKTAFLSFYDLATDFIWADPVASKHAPTTTQCFRFYMGPMKKIELVYCDGHGTLKKACNDLSILRRSSQPGDHQKQRLD